MKKSVPRAWLKALMALTLISALPQWASANDYLEKDKHYRAYANGADRVHFVIPVWAYGKGYDYYAYGDSYIAYKKNGDSDWTRIAWYKTDAYDENENKNTKKGTAYVWPVAGQGTIVVTSMSSGVDKRLTHSGSWSEQLIVKQREDDGCPQVTMLELDWYSPESLDNQPYQVKIESKFRRSYTDGNEMTCTTTYPDFRGNSNIMTPQLYSPYIYQVNDNGPTGYGFAAIPYMTFNDPVSYSTSLNPQHEPATSRGGTLYVMTNDTVQEQFYATFTLWRNKNNADSTSKKSTPVDIPPYHRIYNFTAVQELDSTGTCTGNNVLHWTIKNPGLKDLVDGDFFEIQRALNSNYSDARTIEVVQMLRNENKTQYTYTDESRETWNGNTDMTEVPVDTRLTVKEPKFVLNDQDGQPLAELNASLLSDELRVPTVPVYYRIRRASSSVWGWDIDFTQKVTINNYNFLAPLAETQEPYTLDEAYADNHQVHFSIKIENREPVAVIPDKDRCMLTCSVNKILREDPIEITVQFEQKEGTRANPEGTTAFRVLSDDERVLQNWSYLQAGTYSFPRNCMVQIKNVSGMTYNQEEVFTFRKIANPAVFTCTTEGFAHGSQYFSVGMVSADPTPLTPDKDEGDMDLQIKYTTDGKVPSPDGETAFRVVKQDGTVVKDWSFLTTGLYQFPTGSTVHVKNASARNYEGEYTTSFVLTEPSIITCSAETWIHGSQKVSATMSPNDQIVDGITREINSRLFTVKDSLYRKLLQEHHQMEYGKAMWDRTARLILTRTIEETGQKMEYIIPQDSIVRQADGSWTASFTDVADKACSHYTYTVRIDQSKSDLHVQDSTSLRPMTITGPDLYFDEGAAIRQMEASQGDAGTEMKSGVLVRWQTDTNNYDDFLLLRKPNGSSAAADTLALTTESSFFDRSAQPNVHYDYTVEARYSCNGRHTVNAATAEGWRTPYGEISGSILLPDNTGMAGVTVALQDGTGQVIRTITTDASGAYKFDSLAYADPVCEDPTLNLTISNTPYPSTIMLRVLDANGQVLENWTNKNSGTYTYKTGTVIEAKTTYESDQSYNQVHSFTLRKHSTLTIYTSRIVGQPSKTVFAFNETSECACSDPVDNGRYSVIPTSQYGEFSFNNSPTASITLAPNHAVASGIHFVNNSVARLTGRVLYKNTTIPVSGARFLLNGDTVRRGNVPLATGVNGNFELLVPLSQPCRLQVIKEGHSFEGDGILRVDGGEEEFALTKPLDGVRFYDTTKARLVGRVAGGNDQRDLPRGFGLGRNNLGDNLQLVLQLEGDNTAQLVHDPDDLDRDTLQVRVNHVIYQPGADSLVVGSTQVLFEKKRITIHPDPQTGEFAVDLFPVKYKVVQATATGYATLFGSEQGSETFDLTEAPKLVYTARYDQAAGEIIVGSNSPQILERHYPYSQRTASEARFIDGDSIQYNAMYDRIYHTPMQVGLSQMIYGLERDGLGEPEMEVSHINPSLTGKVGLYAKQPDGSVGYLLGNPVFIGGRKYQFMAEAYEDYYYNNDPQGGNLDRVPLRGGSVTIHNGLQRSQASQKYALDEQGRNQSIWLMVDNYDVNNVGVNALRTVTAALEQENNTVETTLFQGFITGTVVQERDLRMTKSKVVLLDIVRDPGGAGSSAWVESGSTYNYSFKESYHWETGLNLGLKYGLNVSSDIGVVSAPEGVGSYTGSNYTTSKQLSIPIPITHTWDWAYQYDYSITTTERITTSSSSTAKGVGAMADVFFGTTVSQVAGKAKTVSVIGEEMFQLCQPARDAGSMLVLAQGTDSEGNNYYLVTGQKLVLGSTLDNTFAYTQHYVLNTVLPELAMERQNLLMRFASREEAQAAADALGEEVYWYHPEGSLTNPTDTLPSSYYDMVTPQDDRIYTNRVGALNNMLFEWTSILYQNEQEKVTAMGSTPSKVGTYSVSYGATLNHSDSYTASVNYNELPQGWDLIKTEVEKGGSKIGESVLNNLINNVSNFFKTNSDKSFGKSAAEALKNYYNEYYDWASREAGDWENVDGEGGKEMKKPEELGTVTNSSKFSMTFDPVLKFNTDNRDTQVRTVKKSAGFNIVADPDGDITVSCYRVPYQAWIDSTAFIRDNLSILNDDNEALFGSYVFLTEAGATFCPHEDAQRTQFYNPGMLIGNGTQWIVKPEMTANTYEITNVQPQNSAYFQLVLMNNSEVDTGTANAGHSLTLMVDGESNPNGAIVTMDGMPLTQGTAFWVVPGRPLTKTLRVERGTVDDYEDLTLVLYASDCVKTRATIKLSVHFLPVSSDVNIAMPRQNWVMNTLSQRDSIGYYLPVDIDGFDIHHKNFDHIEFQYKLSTESEEMWVNQCSFFASDSLYQLATGNKAMIENGRIEPFRFYGERDPMEQRYDLRAVSFCRYGSGFVTKSSPVMSGIKDTRPPRVFGEPEPVNAILGVGDNLKLRFNEPIAGNYLDEDNNFQIKGVTNATGITTNASVHFDGTDQSYAISQVNRSLSDRSFTLDMLVKPSQTDREETFFEHGTDGEGVRFGLTADNRLQLAFGTLMILSKPLDKMLEFTRVCVVYDNEENKIRFYAGTQDVTDPQAQPLPDAMAYGVSAPLVFGRGFDGNMLELRLWSKALTAEEIAATHMRHLTGYERELVAYYKMSEGQGTTLGDKAGGATLLLHGATWNLPKGISLAVGPGEKVEVNGDLLGRSKAYDETLMFWFRSTNGQGDVFSAGYRQESTQVEAGHWEETGNSNGSPVMGWVVDHDSIVVSERGMLLTLEDGMLVLRSDSNRWNLAPIKANQWQHVVLSVNRTYNQVSAFLNGNLVANIAATEMGDISGAMYFGGNGFGGNIDEFAIFEQALPKALIEQYGTTSPMGDEMGLLAYLPFETQKQNANGVLELVFSPNDQRVFKDSNGRVIDKVVPLLLGVEGSVAELASLADKTVYAPVHSGAMLSKLNFDWAFNNDELLINLNMPDREINKQTVFITVRDVEDLNGNPMMSPVTWVAYVDRNSLIWEYRTVELFQVYGLGVEDEEEYGYEVRVLNTSGRRHQFQIESLPDWLSVDQSFGTIQPADDYTIRFTYDRSLPVGVYTDIVYVTDENGLSEPLKVVYTVEGFCPWDEVDTGDLDNSMSLRGQVVIAGANNSFDTEADDVVAVFCEGVLVGRAKNSFDNVSNKSYVYLTIYGNSKFDGKLLQFKLWRASTGKTYTLTPSVSVRFQANAMYGITPDLPVQLKTGVVEVQQLTYTQGWNWVSWYLFPYSTVMPSVFPVESGFSVGDIVKSPADRTFSMMSSVGGGINWVGGLVTVTHQQMYMVHTAKSFTSSLEGVTLTAAQSAITLRNGWNGIPFLLDEPVPVMDALADYLDHATYGDIVKSRTQFAVFTENGKWEGSLQTMRPGQGYLLKRLGKDPVTIHYVKPSKRRAVTDTDDDAGFSNPEAASNMTMIAVVSPESGVGAGTLRAYVDNELAAVSQPVDSVYFLTIQSNRTGDLVFRTENGTRLVPMDGSIAYEADSHQGSVQRPVVLAPVVEQGAYKIIENDQVIIVRGDERYDVTGRKLK